MGRVKLGCDGEIVYIVYGAGVGCWVEGWVEDKVTLGVWAWTACTRG